MRPKSYSMNLLSCLNGTDWAKLGTSCSESYTSPLLRWSALYSSSLSQYAGSLAHPLGICSSCYNSFQLLDEWMLSYAPWYPMNCQFITFTEVVLSQLGAYWCGVLLFHAHLTGHLRPWATLVVWPMFSYLSPMIYMPASASQPFSLSPTSTSLLCSLNSHAWPSLDLPSEAWSDLAPSADPSHSSTPCSPLWCSAMSRPSWTSWSGSSPTLARSDRPSSSRRLGWSGRQGRRLGVWSFPRSHWAGL